MVKQLPAIPLIQRQSASDNEQGCDRCAYGVMLRFLIFLMIPDVTTARVTVITARINKTVLSVGLSPSQTFTSQIRVKAALATVMMVKDIAEAGRRIGSSRKFMRATP
jgi:hypothetical protein